jgi:N-acetylmuramoyl-L-alanine amidase
MIKSDESYTVKKKMAIRGVRDMAKKTHKLLVVLVMLLLVFWGESYAAGTSQEVAVVTGESLNIRSGPGTNHSIVAQAVRGDKLPVLEKRNDWYRVTVPGGKQGWVAGWRVKVKKAVPAVSKPGPNHVQADVAVTRQDALITADIVNVRSGAGTGFQIVSKVKKGEKHAIIGQEKNWLQLDLGNGIKGWIAEWLAEVIEESAANIGSDRPGIAVFEKMAVITADIVNARRGAGTGFEVVRKVKLDERFLLIKQQEDWLQLDFGNGEVGWVAGWLAEVREIRAEEFVAGRGESKPDSDLEAGGDKPATPTVVPTGEGSDPSLGESQPIPIPSNPAHVKLPEHLSIINHISFEAVEKGGQVIVRSDKPIQGYNLFTLSEPNRIVLDIEQAFLAIQEKQEWSGGNTALIGLRLGQFSPEQVRVVFDLAESIGYSAKLSADRKELRVTISPASPTVLDGKVIGLDPGHGGINSIGINDPGAIGPSGLIERDIVTDISHQLKKMLEEMGATVVMTRTGNSTNLSLEGRANMVNNLGADIFVSIHANASLSPLQNGTSVFYYAPLDNEFGSQRSARRLLAQSIQTELVNELKLRDMGIIEKNLAVLRYTTMPSALVEVAYISNPAEEKLLADAAFRKRAAERIMRGIVQYFVGIN